MGSCHYYLTKMVRGRHIIMHSSMLQHSVYVSMGFNFAEAVVGESVVVIKKLLQLHVSYFTHTHISCI